MSCRTCASTCRNAAPAVPAAQRSSSPLRSRTCREAPDDPVEARSSGIGLPDGLGAYQAGAAAGRQVVVGLAEPVDAVVRAARDVREGPPELLDVAPAPRPGQVGLGLVGRVPDDHL